MDIKKKKCLVWDLDNTLWDGILTEDSNVKLFPNIVDIIKTLDNRGILQSIASKNDYEIAMNKLKEFGLEKYFIYPQINWNSKADSIKNISESINIGIDAIVFIDDNSSELEEVKFVHPDVSVINALEYNTILDLEYLKPNFITSDSKQRRQMYLNDIVRKKEEKEFTGSNKEFLKTLNMEVTISNVKEEDLQRVEELTIRTNQLNSTGYTYSYDELKDFIKSDKHIFLTVHLKDRLGDYGKVGLCLLEETEKSLSIKLLLMSCRVMTKGIGSTMLTNIIKLSESKNKRLFAEFLHTDRNRIMYITYKMNGFVGSDEDLDVGDTEKLEYLSKNNHDYLDYINIILDC